MLELYSQPFILSLLISTVLTVVFVLMQTSGRGDGVIKSYFISQILFRSGGVAAGLAFLLVFFLDKNLQFTQDLWGLIFGSVLIVIFGVVDDIYKLHWKYQIVFQVFLAFIIFYIFDVRMDVRSIDLFASFESGSVIVMGIGLVLTTAWMIALINSLNWLDGMDGLSGGVIVLAGIFLLLLSLKPEVNQPPVGIISLILAGAYVGFLVFNVYPAKIILGTVGTYLAGFILAYLSIYAGAKIATALLILSLPLLDALWVIWRRVRDGVSIFRSDTSRHLHYRLRDRGWSEYKIMFFFYGTTLVLGVVALYTREMGKGIALGIATLLLLGILFWSHEDHKEGKKLLQK